jgi:hypothetical protein
MIFKNSYIHCTFCSILDASGKEIFVSIIELWKSHSTAECIAYIKKSMEELKSTILNGCWMEL